MRLRSESLACGGGGSGGGGSSSGSGVGVGGGDVSGVVVVAVMEQVCAVCCVGGGQVFCSNP